MISYYLFYYVLSCLSCGLFFVLCLWAVLLAFVILLFVSLSFFVSFILCQFSCAHCPVHFVLSEFVLISFGRYFRRNINIRQ